MNIEDLMTAHVCVCSPSDTLNRAAQIMWQDDCGFLPVVDYANRVVGVITDRDICMGAYTQGVPLRAAPVSRVMSKYVCTCRPDDSLDHVEQLMRERQIRRLPVVDTSDELLGVITLGDLARSTQSNALRRATSGLGIAKTLTSICERRPTRSVNAAAE